jgi:hypothetical protein
MIIAFIVFVTTLFVWQRFIEEDTNPDTNPDMTDIMLKITITFLSSLIWPVTIPVAGIFVIGWLVMALASRK